ncbi:MAG: hypothetical protein NTZ05_17300 [Chloroflexi bacterium]|nr:hypothetical protein [Chloroflexota bacterium]
MGEIAFEVEGFPPNKYEGLSLFNARHGQARQVRQLLEAAQQAISRTGFAVIADPLPVGLEVTLFAENPGGDATNYLGGIGDVLQDTKAGRGHLGGLADAALYENDRQLQEIQYRLRPDARPHYTVRVWNLA